MDRELKKVTLKEFELLREVFQLGKWEREGELGFDLLTFCTFRLSGSTRLKSDRTVTWVCSVACTCTVVALGKHRLIKATIASL